MRLVGLCAPSQVPDFTLELTLADSVTSHPNVSIFFLLCDRRAYKSPSRPALPHREYHLPSRWTTQFYNSANLLFCGGGLDLFFPLFSVKAWHISQLWQ